jgi:hypothetical protein
VYVYSVTVHMMLRFRWFVSCGCLDCSCWGESLLYGGRVSWLFIVGVFVMSVVLIPRL